MKTVAISSIGLTIGTARNESVGAIEFSGNKRLQFLPENPANNFPNLEIYQASGCAIERIHRNNFRNLSKLRVLWLTSNPLEKISSDTFKDLISLESLVLSKIIKLTIFTLLLSFLSPVYNRIKFMNGAVFEGLNKLKIVYLQKNQCIDEFFFPASRHAPMLQAVNDKCGFVEEHVTEAPIDQHNSQQTNVKLQDDLRKAKIQIEDLQMLTELKLKEISELLNYITLKDQEINLLNAKIYKLEEKVSMLSSNRID